MSQTIVSQFILIIGLLAVGYVCRKLDVIDENAGKYLSKILLCLTIPATAIEAAIGKPLENLANVLVFLGIASALFVVVPLIGKLLCKIIKWSEVYRLMLTFGNTGFVGIPVSAAVWGQESVFYVTLFMMTFNIAFFTWGVATMKRISGYNANAEALGRPKPSFKQRVAKTWRDLLNPGIISALLALLIFLFQIPIQEDLARLISTVASINTPLAMIVIGASLASVPIKDIFNDKYVYLFAAIKLMALPALVLAVLAFCPIDPLLVGIFVVLECMPVAGNLSMIAIQYHGDINLVSKATALTTLFFIPSVLFWSYIVRLVVAI